MKYTLEKDKLTIEIMELILDLENQARVAFKAAKQEGKQNKFGERFIAHGATIKFTVSQELRRLIF